MAALNRVLWSVGLCLGLIALTQCSPVEYVYTGDGCECPQKLGFQINYPCPPKPKPYVPAVYGYKVDVPLPAKPQLGYNYDFIVEEPRTPPPKVLPKYDLYAKIDRVTVKKADCLPSYAPPPPPLAYAYKPPSYRYVYKKVQPCLCKGSNCKCNQGRPLAGNSIDAAPDAVDAPAKRSAVNIRRKRDLPHPLFRRRKQAEERKSRFVKLYHKSLPAPEKPALFGFNNFVDPMARRETKRTYRKGLFQPRLKRDIKGEYDQLEKDREQMDLTLPEVVQYMPEALEPTFKRGQCRFGCSEKLEATEIKPEGAIEERITPRPMAGRTEKSLDLNSGQTDEQIYDKTGQNNIASTYRKRNAGFYNCGILPRPTASASPISGTEVPSFRPQIAYRAAAVPSSSPLIPIHPIPVGSTQNAYSAPPPPPPQYVYDASTGKYVPNDGRQRFMISQVSIPDPTGADPMPLRYAGDLESPPAYTGQRSQSAPALDTGGYPIQFLTNSQLDQIIADIVFRHPDFVHATSHYGGALVDPEPIQEQQTKAFLKKLIDGRLGLLQTEEEDYTPNYGPLYSPYRAPTALNYYQSGL